MNMRPTRSVPPSRPALWMAPLVLVLAAGGGLGCFRATGVTRPNLAVEEIPQVGGDRVAGLKATAGPGDFYVGNDYVQLAVDGAAFGDQPGQLGAPSGGSVLDIGTISLDQSFKRVSMPDDMLGRLGPVANQDPDLPLVFDHYLPGKSNNLVYLDMQGYLLDPKGKLGATLDAQGRVVGVAVDHRISLGLRDTYFTLETTVTNHSGATLPIENLGDFLSQQGGGYRFVVPATKAFDGTPITSWGAEIPGSDFANPLTTSVQAPMVALTSPESSGATYDDHSGLGILPVDTDQVLVTSDPQHPLTEDRPVVPARLVVGGPAIAGLADGQSLTYRRRVYVTGGPSFYPSSLGNASKPTPSNTVFNAMAIARTGLRGGDLGFVAFNSFGTATLGGPLQAEYRIERYLGSAADASTDLNPANWSLERVEWRDKGDAPSSASPVQMYLPAVADPNFSGQNQRYRITVRNRNQSATFYTATNSLNTSRPNLATPIEPSKTQAWSLAESLAPERFDVIDSAGNVIAQKQSLHTFSAREAGATVYDGLQPLRITFAGIGATPDPDMQRTRKVSSYFEPIYKGKAVAGGNVGSYQYQAGNQAFGSSFAYIYSALSSFFPSGDYLAYATRGPLSFLDTLPVSAFDGQTNTSHTFVVLKASLPVGWTSFDLPGPTQATTGGFNPGEMLSSALSEGVQVVARTEHDLQTDPTALRAEFRAEFDANNANISDAQRDPIGNDPFVVGARSSTLADGTVTALFTPAPTTTRFGGALPSAGWTLADFLTQAQGAFNVIERPRGPKGLFTVRGFDPAVALGSGTNAWWTQTGPVSLGKREGDFDAIELLRGEYSDASGNPLPLTDPANATAWFNEFLAVRNDWFGLISQQGPGTFTKGLGLSSARYSLDTPVGLARTYLNLGSATLDQNDLSPVLKALQAGAAVASTGPFVDATVNGTGPGGLVAGPVSSVTLTVNLYAPDWVPVDEVRVVVNGVVQTLPLTSFTPSTTDSRLRTATATLAMPTTGKDAWIVVEAGVPLTTTGAYAAGTPWAKIMKGIYPVAVTNPIFVDVNGGGYTPPFP
ncbi:MAG TPA: hypothetical protein VF804_11440 [Holophagaceae bacterium]